MRIYLIGFMGAGKTTLGRLLAERLGAPFVDLDPRIEQAAGMTIEEIFQQQGEAEFRRREELALIATAELDPVVVATGGGLVTTPACRDWMRGHGVSFWLNPPLETLLARLDPASRAHRPLGTDDAALRDLWHQRRSLYAGADRELVIPPHERAEATVERLLSQLEEMRCAT